jgi:ATP-dependent DNA helicase RecQ
VARALAAWAEQGEPVELKALALSAEVAMTTTRSLCAQLEEGGLLERQRGRGYLATVEPAALRDGAMDLARRFEIERRQDVRRLRAVAEYAETEACRSVFLRRWFGEDDPPECGSCDRCRERLAERRADRRAEGRAAAPRRRRRRRPRRSRGSGG